MTWAASRRSASPDWARDPARVAGRKAMLDPQATALREQVLGQLLDGFKGAGDYLRLAGSLVGPGRDDGTKGDDRLIAMGYIAATAAELLRGVRSLLRDSNVYAAAALVRQLVELEYLAWAFAEDQDEAASWLLSTHEDRLARWQPRHIRQRSADRFRSKDYSLHCERGGHPTPMGCRGLINGDREVNVASQHLESVLHGSSAWRYLIAATDVFAADNQWEPQQLLPSAARIPTPETLRKWWDYDPMRNFVVLMPVPTEGR